MLRILFLMIAMLALTGCDRSSLPMTAEIATCIQARVPDNSDELQGLGEQTDAASPGLPIQLRRFDYLGCRGAKGLFDNDATLTAQGLALSAKLRRAHAFRVGIQVLAWRSLGKPPFIATGLAQLTVRASENTLVRTWGQACGLVPEDLAATLRDMEAPYLLAFIGTRGWASSMDEARSLATQVADASTTEVLRDASLAGGSCADASLQAQLTAYFTAVQAFGKGRDPLLPGCKVVPQEGELVLSCEAPPANR